MAMRVQHVAGHTGLELFDDGVGDLLPTGAEIAQRGRRPARDPRASDIRRVALVSHDRVGPDHVAFADDVIDRDQVERHVVVGAPRSVGDPFGHGLEHRVEEVARRAQLEQSTQEHRRQIGEPDPRPQDLLRGVRRGFVDLPRAPHAFLLVASLDDARPRRVAARRRRARPARAAAGGGTTWARCSRRSRSASPRHRSARAPPRPSPRHLPRSRRRAADGRDRPRGRAGSRPCTT